MWSVLDYRRLEDNTKVLVIVQSMDGVKTKTLNMTYDEFRTRAIRHYKGELIQSAFDNLSLSEREFLLTGLDEEEWNNLFGKEDE